MGNVLLSDPCRADDKSVLGFYADDGGELVPKIGEDIYIDYKYWQSDLTLSCEIQKSYRGYNKCFFYIT